MEDRRTAMLIRALFSVDPATSVSLLILILLACLIPTATRVLIGGLTGAVQASGVNTEAWVIACVLGVLFILHSLTIRASSVLAEILGLRVSHDARRRLMDLVALPAGTEHLDDPAVHNLISRAQVIGLGRFGLESATLGLTMLTIRVGTAIASGALLFGFSWWLPLLLTIAVLFLNRRVRYSFFSHAMGVIGQTHLVRRSSYVRDVGFTLPVGKEVRIFGFRSWFLDWFGRESNSMQHSLSQARGRFFPLAIGRGLATILLYGSAFAILTNALLNERISAAAFVIYSQAVVALLTVSSLDDYDIFLNYGAEPLVAIDELEEQVVNQQAPTEIHIRDAVLGGAQTIRFEHVAFHYPRSERQVLDDCSFEFRVGTSLGIVGPNGAGKTTLVRLLCKLYRPSSGQILLGDSNIGDVETEEWQRGIAAMFQDLVRYPLTMRENITLGAGGEDVSSELLRRVITESQLSEIVERLPNGLDTVLSRLFKDGMELSHGEWQRVGLARCLIAIATGKRLLILDEPTASLDPMAEAELYRNFVQLTRGLSTVLVSHRLAGISRVDKIIVLSKGRIVETGTHHELLELGGRYAYMYRTQAEMFGTSLHK